VLQCDRMAHSVTLRPQIADIFRSAQTRQPDSFDDLDAVTAEPSVLCRIVRHQAYVANAEMRKDLGADAVASRVHREPLGDVGVDCIHALILQGVSTDLVCQTDASALMTTQIHDSATPLTRDGLQCLF
jgi:hypothetical protein